MPFGIQNQLAVCTHLRDDPTDLIIQIIVEDDRIVPVFQQRGVRFDPIRNVGMAENPAPQQGRKLVQMELVRDLQEFLQVDDLVVAPVANVSPGTARTWLFPLDPSAGHSIRVVSIGGRGADEAADHTLHVFGIAVGQCLPVLKDVAPIPLIV